MALAVILTAAALAYANSFQGVFVFDDVTEIGANPTLRSLWPIWRPMFEGWQLPARPLPYLSFAIDLRLWGTNPWGFHLTSVSLHLLAAALLFYLARDTLAGPQLPAAVRQLAIGLAAAIAMVWAVHPLTTQAVTYIYQRIELLASLCMLTCLLATNRVWHPTEQTDRLLGWKLLALAAACLAMLSKETAVVLPLLVLLQGWLLTERPAVALRQQGRFLLLLAGSWLVLFAVLLAQRQHYAEIEKAVHPPLAYLLTQAGVIVHYLRLVVWPSGQCLDYDWPLADSPLTVWWQGPLVVAGVVATASGLWRRQVWAFPAAGFFLVLAPTSSLVPVADIANEHRMYLPLAFLLGLTIPAGWWLMVSRTGDGSQQATRRLFALVIFGVTAVLGGITHNRNTVYASRWAMWTDVLAKRPENPRAHWFTGLMLAEQGQTDEALAHAGRATRLDPFVRAYQQLGQIFNDAGDRASWERACREGRATLTALGKAAAPPTLDLGVGQATALLELGRATEARRLLDELLPEIQQHLPADHGVRFAARLLSLRLQLAAGQPALADARRLLDDAATALGPAHATTLAAETALAVSLAATGEDAEAEARLRSVLASQQQKPANLPATDTAATTLAGFLKSRDRWPAVGQLWQQLAEDRCQQLGVSHPASQRALRAWADAASHSGRTEDAAAIRRLLLPATSGPVTDRDHRR